MATYILLARLSPEAVAESKFVETVRFRTHSIRGLHENDFIMAAKANLLLQTGLPPS